MSSKSDTKRKRGATALKSVTELSTSTPLSKSGKKGKTLYLGKAPETAVGSRLSPETKDRASLEASLMKNAPKEDRIVPDPSGRQYAPLPNTLEYNYGDKLPKKQTVPIPSEQLRQKHAYKVKYS